MISCVQQLQGVPAFKSHDLSVGGLQPLIHLLMEKRFSGFRELVQKYVDITENGQAYLNGPEWKQVALALKQTFLILSNQITTIDRLLELTAKAKALHDFSHTPAEPEAYITIASAMNSTLYSSGNITVFGQGSINSKIHAGGTVRVQQIVRGGTLYGRLGIEVNEVGSTSGTKTILTVPNDQRIKIRKAMEGTTIRIGNTAFTFEATTYDIDAKTNEMNKIIFK